MSFLSVPERVRRQVAARPSAPAVVYCGEVALTFEALWDRACAVASALRGAGVVPGERVGLHLARSPELVVAWLGSWLAGVAFVPLDPGAPAARRAAIARETRLAARLTADGLPAWEGPDAPVFDVGAVLPAPGFEPVAVRPEDTAYVLYTSGSTGAPKGVVVPHRGLPGLLDAQVEAFHLGPASRALWYLSPAFDASVSDVCTAWVAGAALCLEGPADLASPAGILEVLRRRSITHADLPPAILPLLDPAHLPPSLETVVIGGEACDPETVRRWASRVRLVNVYGPTEATVCASLGVCDPATWDRPRLGRPLGGVRFRVVGDDGADAETGELWIGGDGVADGYLDRPALTAARFVTHGGSRWFRTGDQVARLADGDLAFLGRSDRQVKVRGVLVAPEEVEARLAAHPAVAEAAVGVRRLGATDALVGWYRTRGPVTAAALRAFVAETLPPALVPAHLVAVATLPRTASGKVDAAALPDPAPDLGRGGPPATATEARLAALWQQVLGTGAPGRDDDFFDLGGDSFAVLALLAAGEGAGLPLTADRIYRATTLRALAATVEAPGAGDPAADRMSAEALRADAALGPDLEAALARSRRRRRRPRPGDEAGAPGAILLTGATGFLGGHVLETLLRNTSAPVVCLVRAGDDGHARRRLEATRARLAKTLRADAPPGRLRVLAGDLAAPNLGVNGDTWAGLADAVGTIFHCAAEVNLVRPYAALRPANLEGTRRLVALMATGRPKALHHASTLSVFLGSDRNTGVMREDDDLAATRWVEGGYAQGKWAAEALLRATGGDAGPVVLHRFGLLVGADAGGPLPARDWLRRFVRALAALGAYPEGDEARVDLTPVDWAAAAMVHVALHQAPPPTVTAYHLASPAAASLADLAGALARAGVTLEALAPEAWAERLAEVGVDDAAVAGLLGGSRWLPGRGTYARARAFDVFQATGAVFDRRRLEAALAGTDLACPRPTPARLDAYVARLLEGADR